MKTILVTGGSGFIGTNFIDTLENKNFQIINLDKCPPIKPSHASYWHEVNIMNYDQVVNTLVKYKPDIVVHLAARTDTLSNVLSDYDENIKGNENVIDAVKSVSFVERLIVTSTQYVYKSPDKPYPDRDDEYRPYTVYGESKVQTEKYTRNANLECVWTIVRPTNIWGPWHMRYPNELWKIIDKGLYFHPVNHEVIRTYGYVKNIVYQLNQIVNASPSLVHKKTFYLGDAPVDSFKWLNELSLQLTQKSAKRLPKFIFSSTALVGDVLRAVKIPFPIYTRRFHNMIEDYAAPTDKTIEIFGVAQLDMRENVKETVDWLKTEGRHYFDYWKSKYN